MILDLFQCYKDLLLPSHHGAAVLLPRRPRAVHSALGRHKVEAAHCRRVCVQPTGDIFREFLPGDDGAFRESPRGGGGGGHGDDLDGLAAEVAAKVRGELRGAVVVAAAHAARTVDGVGSLFEFYYSR